MRAVAIEKFGDVSQLQQISLPKPVPSDSEILVNIHYAGVNPVDWKIREGVLKDFFPHTFPIVLGWDAAGVVESVGTQVSKYQPGDKVYAYCRKPTVQWGTYAEYIVLEEEHLSLMPENLSFAQASTIPLASLTAWQALYDSAKLSTEHTILIHAGAGGVGSFAIQLAKHTGATVITTASPINHPYVKSLGADIIIDYTTQNFVSVIKEQFPDGIDIVFDLVGGEIMQNSFDVLKERGHLVSIVGPPDEHTIKNISTCLVFVKPNPQQLSKITEMIENKTLFAPPVKEYPLELAKQALKEIKAGHVRGKLTLKIN